MPLHEAVAGSGGEIERIYLGEVECNGVIAVTYLVNSFKASYMPHVDPLISRQLSIFDRKALLGWKL